VVTVGKVDQVLGGRGITDVVAAAGNAEVLRGVRAELGMLPCGLLVANLVDFDMVYGHRRDVAGFSRALEAFDGALGDLLAHLGRRDLLVITADHGCDPTAPGSDHTREYVPLLMTGRCVREGTRLGVRPTFADLGATLCEALGLRPPANGTSFWADLARCGEVPDLGHERTGWLRRRGIAD
jgi:phosphopentomutase